MKCTLYILFASYMSVAYVGKHIRSQIGLNGLFSLFGKIIQKENLNPLKSNLKMHFLLAETADSLDLCFQGF